MNNVLFSRFFNIYRPLRITLSLIVSLVFCLRQGLHSIAHIKDNISLVCFFSISHRIEFHRIFSLGSRARLGSRFV